MLGQPAGTFFHVSAWSGVLERAFGHKPRYLLAEDSSGEICGVLPLAHVESLIFGNTLVSTPFCVYGGIVAASEKAKAALVSAAVDLANELQVDYLELRNRSNEQPDWPTKDLYVTFRRPIDPDSEKNLLAIPRKQRAMVRKGIKAGLRAEVDASANRLYKIYSDSVRNLGTPVFGRRYFDVLLEAFPSSTEILTVMHGDEAVASVLSFRFREEILPYYGGGTRNARAVAGNDYMYWAVMDRARESGCQLFDYGRSKRGSGSYEFKEHWGFEPEPLYYQYYLAAGKEMPNLSPANPKFQLAIRIWRGLPLWIAEAIGPRVAKYLG